MNANPNGTGPPGIPIDRCMNACDSDLDDPNPTGSSPGFAGVAVTV